MFDKHRKDLEIELRLSRKAVAQLQKEREEVEGKAKKVTEDLEPKNVFCRIYCCSAGGLFNMLLLRCRVSLQHVGIVQSVQRSGEGLGREARGSGCGDKPVLDYIGFEPPEGTTRLPGDMPP